MSVPKEDLLSGAEALLPQAIELRRAIHRHPELGLELPRTKARVLEVLGEIDDLQIVESERTSGVIATLKGAGNGPTILLRGDMDALPMPEDTGLAFASEVEGCMHACGHDSHVAMLAMAAKLLANHRDQLQGNVAFMFQPGEEGYAGAKVMLDEGLLDVPPAPQAAFALHIFPNLPNGVIATRPGPMLAAADTFRIDVVGRGGHASMPHQANDPIPVACEIVTALQTLVTRRIPAFDPVVLTVAKIEAGTTSNVIPESAGILGTLRSFSPRSREIAIDGLERVTSNIAAAHEMQGNIEVSTGYPPTLNDAEFADFVGTVARDLLGENGYQPLRAPMMGAEDFSYILQKMPGAMAGLGVAPDGVEPKDAPPCHSNRMLLNESAMQQGIAMHAAVALRYLEGAAN